MKDPAESRCCLEGTACIPAVKLRELPCNFNSKTCLVPLGPTLTGCGVANTCCKPRSRTVLHMCLRDSQGERDCRESERARERESERERGAERELFIPEENHRANVIQPKSGSAALSPLSSTNTSRAAVLPPRRPPYIPLILQQPNTTEKPDGALSWQADAQRCTAAAYNPHPHPKP